MLIKIDVSRFSSVADGNRTNDIDIYERKLMKKLIDHGIKGTECEVAIDNVPFRVVAFGITTPNPRDID